MPKYERGDVVLVAFKFQETSETKKRPAVVIESYHDSCLICQITSRDRRGERRGFWVAKESSDGEKMGIEMDSFINADVTQEVSFLMIFKTIGFCPFIDKLEEMILL